VTGEHLSADIRSFLAALHRHRVRFLIVGGEAVIHHAYARLTGAIDLFFEQTRPNVERLYAALLEFWRGQVPAVRSPEELLEEGIVVQFGVVPNRIDLISSLESVGFAAAWRRRVVETMRTGGKRVTIGFIGLRDLIENKRAVGRHKDLDDVEHLTRRGAARAKGRGRRKPGRSSR
jgi:hypothetical protein